MGGRSLRDWWVEKLPQVPTTYYMTFRFHYIRVELDDQVTTVLLVGREDKEFKERRGQVARKVHVDCL